MSLYRRTWYIIIMLSTIGIANLPHPIFNQKIKVDRKNITNDGSGGTFSFTAGNNNFAKINGIFIHLRNKNNSIKADLKNILVNNKPIRIINPSGQQEVKQILINGAFNTINIPNKIAILELSPHTEQYFLTCDSNFIKEMDIIIQDNTLTAQLKEYDQPVGYNIGNQPMCTFKGKFIGDYLNAQGSSRVSLDTFASHKKITLESSGNSRFNIGNISTKKLIIQSSGSGKTTIKGGNVEKQDIKLSGSGKYNAHAVLSQICQITASGSSRARVNVQNILFGTISGSSKVRFKGPAENRVTVNGSGSCKPAK